MPGFNTFRIEISGPPGAGKTALALALQKCVPDNPRLVLENYKDVPFWEECWLHPGKYEFERDLSFLLYQYRLIRSVEQDVNSICDFAFFENQAYAKISNSEAEYALFESIYRRLENKIFRPNVVVNLICPPPVLLMRVNNRGRGPERRITQEFLENLSQAIGLELARLCGEADVRTITINIGSQLHLRAEDLAVEIWPAIKWEMERARH